MMQTAFSGYSKSIDRYFCTTLSVKRLFSLSVHLFLLVMFCHLVCYNPYRSINYLPFLVAQLPERNL